MADCRFDLADPSAGRRAYDRNHIPGAVYFDLETDLSGPAGQGRGRHPLPDLEEFGLKLGKAGIGEGVCVVCYDDGDGAMAARLWWMLRYLGHDGAAVLDGGYKAWLGSGLPVTAEVPKPLARSFVPRPRPELAATMEEVRAMSAAGRGVLIDCRAPERYRGEVEPLDPVAGHIPGARNLPWMDNLDPSGRFRSRDELVRRFEQLDGQDPIVLYCGSGVTACVNLLAMAQAGIRAKPKLYVGGFSQWCSVPENAVARVDPRRSL